MSVARKNLRVGLVGVGGAAQVNHIPALKKVEGVDLVALVDRDPEKAHRVAQKFQVERATARTGARVVASANPGCAIHLRAAGLIVRHPVNLLAQGISGEPADQLAPSLAADPAGF